jgi:hypothetical protein
LAEVGLSSPKTQKPPQLGFRDERLAEEASAQQLF